MRHISVGLVLRVEDDIAADHEALRGWGCEREA